MLVLRQRRLEYELQIPPARKVAGEIGIHRGFDRLLVQFLAGGGVAKSFLARFQRKQHDVFPRRHRVEVLRGLERVAQVSGPRHDELISAMPLAHQALGFFELLAPAVGSNRRLRDVAVENRAGGFLGDLGAELAVAAELDDAASHLVDHACHGENL